MNPMASVIVKLPDGKEAFFAFDADSHGKWNLLMSVNAEDMDLSSVAELFLEAAEEARLLVEECA